MRASAEDRFWPKVVRDPDTNCWEWIGLRTQQGYGEFFSGHKWMAHRWSWQYLRGVIPEGLELDHLCRNTGCVNPDHLEPVTHKENMRRSPRSAPHRNARKTHCKYGHPYDEVNTVVYQGKRHCRACERDKYRRKREAATA